MRFLVDMPLSPELARNLVFHGHDAVHAGTVGLATAPDADIMAFAVQEHRIVVTADLDYPRLLAQSKGTEPSLILFRGGSWSERQVIDRMHQILYLVAADDFSSAIFVVEEKRIRRRLLPH